MTTELIAICLVIPGTAFLLKVVENGKYARSKDLDEFRKEMKNLIADTRFQVHTGFKELRADIKDILKRL